ncbi:MAG: hypothetical protein QHH10_04585 [Peptococcaceae bacterium]|jgi:hypothetical protein|nr:hypothetical protein [Peptococcaceae bacterium]MDH7524574.1 hypothetical protein [Peptococcaceae bacterium]
MNWHRTLCFLLAVLLALGILTAGCAKKDADPGRQQDYIENNSELVKLLMIGYSHLMEGELLAGGEKVDGYQVEEAVRQHMFGYGLNKPSNR